MVRYDQVQLRQLYLGCVTGGVRARDVPNQGFLSLLQTRPGKLHHEFPAPQAY